MVDKFRGKVFPELVSTIEDEGDWQNSCEEFVFVFDFIKPLFYFVFLFCVPLFTASVLIENHSEREFWNYAKQADCDLQDPFIKLTCTPPWRRSQPKQTYSKTPR